MYGLGTGLRNEKKTHWTCPVKAHRIRTCDRDLTHRGNVTEACAWGSEHYMRRAEDQGSLCLSERYRRVGRGGAHEFTGGKRKRDCHPQWRHTQHMTQTFLMLTQADGHDISTAVNWYLLCTESHPST